MLRIDLEMYKLPRGSHLVGVCSSNTYALPTVDTKNNYDHQSQKK